MKNVNRWALAAGLSAALAFLGSARAQSSAGGSSDTGGMQPGGSSATGETGSSTEQGAAPAAPSEPGTPMGAEPGTKAGAPGAESATAGQKVSKGLQDKLEKIHAANQAEIELGQLGTQKAQSSAVKQFSEQMQADHQNADQKLTEAAQSMGISLEGKTFQKEKDRAAKETKKLESKTGATFDKDYMSRLVKDHERDVKEAQSAAKDAHKAKHTELAALLDQTHTGFQGHLQHAKQVEKSLKQGRPPAGTSGTGSSGMEPGMSHEPGSQQ